MTRTTQFWSPESAAPVVPATTPPAPPAPPPAGVPPATPPTPPATPPGTPPAAPPGVPPATPPATPPVDPNAPPATPPGAPPPTPPAPAGPPERYELTLPAGQVLPQAALDTIAAIARTEGWTQEQAQATVTATAAANMQQRAALKAEFDAHPELSGANAVAAEERFLRVVDRFLPASTPEGERLRLELQQTGHQYHVPIRLLLANIGRAMGEDPGLASAARSQFGSGRKPDASVMYPNQK